jgi:hypothetical protein
MLAGGGGVDTISSSSHAHNQFPFLPYTGTLPPHGPEQRISFPGRAGGTPLPHHASRPVGAQADSTVPVTMELQPLMPLVFQPSLNIVMLQYNSIWARIHHFLYAFIYFAHIPITLFFDYTVLYALVQIALHPHPSTSTSSGADSITVRANPWWILVGFYALCTLVWLGVILIYEVYYCYIRQWEQGQSPMASSYKANILMRFSSRIHRQSFYHGNLPQAIGIQSMLDTIFLALLLLVRFLLAYKGTR